MNVDFTSTEQARIQAEAQRQGMDPAQMLRHIVLEHLPTAQPGQDWRARLREWQEQDGIQLMTTTPAGELFSPWEAEYQQMTERERRAEDRLWEELEDALDKAVLELRPAF